MPVAVDEPVGAPEIEELLSANSPRTFRRLLRRPGRRQVFLGFLALIFALSLGLMQVYTRRTRPHRASVWGWSGKGRSRPATHELDMGIVPVNSTGCEWDSSTDYFDQLPARRHFWGGWSRVPARPEQATCPSHASPTSKSGAYSLRRRRYTRQRPLDVNRWTCTHVAQWLGEQRWHWSELPRYQSRICAVGVDGATLYFVDEFDLEQDLQIGYRLHRKLLLDAIASLKEQQPDGTAEPGNLWEYIHDDPTTAALYVSGVLCTPRLTMLWLHTFEYNTTLGPLLADEDESNDQVAYHAPRSIQEFLVLFPIRANKVLFWIGWLCCPALMVAYHALRCAEINLLVSAYVIAISISKQFTEWHSLCETLLRNQMSISDKLASWVCSHLMTPALSMMLAVLHLVFSQVMPAWACSALFWGRIFVLPPLSIWASWASWVPLPPASEQGDDFTPGPTVGPTRSQRASSTTSTGTPACFWPEPLSIPPDLDDCPDVPASFRCPITYEIMREPAIALSGHTYEREAIVTWLSGLQAQADPVTKAPIDPRQIAPNLALRSVILDWLWRHVHVRGTPHGAHSVPGFNPAAVGAAGTSSHGSHSIMHASYTHPVSPSCSMHHGSMFNASTSGFCTTPAHRSASGALRVDAAAQQLPESAAGVSGSAFATSGAMPAFASGPFVTAAASVDDLLIRSASDGALQMPLGCAGSIQSLAKQCRCPRCMQLAAASQVTAGSSYSLASLSRGPGQTSASLRDRDTQCDGQHVNVSRSGHSHTAQSDTPRRMDSNRRFGSGVSHRRNGSGTVNSASQLCHDMGSMSFGSARSTDSVACSTAAGGITSSAALAASACASSSTAANVGAQQAGDLALHRGAPAHCSENKEGRDGNGSASAARGRTFSSGDDASLSAVAGLRRRALHVNSNPPPGLPAHLLGACTAGASVSPPATDAASPHATRKVSRLSRLSVGTPVARHVYTQATHSGPSHEEPCDSHPRELEHVHEHSCSESSRSFISCCSMQQQQQQRMLRQQHLHATSMSGHSGMHASHACMRFTTQSGFASEGQGCSRVTSNFRTMHSRTSSLGGSPRQASDWQCMKGMNCGVPAVSGNSVLASGMVTPPCACCSGNMHTWGQEGQPATLKPHDCIDLVEPILEHFQPHRRVHPMEGLHGAAGAPFAHLHALNALVPRGHQHQRRGEASSIKPTSPSAAVHHSHTHNARPEEEIQRCMSPTSSNVQSFRSTGSRHRDPELFAKDTLLRVCAASREPDTIKGSVTARSFCGLQDVRSTMHDKDAASSLVRSHSAPSAENF